MENLGYLIAIEKTLTGAVDASSIAESLASIRARRGGSELTRSKLLDKELATQGVPTPVHTEDIQTLLLWQVSTNA